MRAATEPRLPLPTAMAGAGGGGVMVQRWAWIPRDPCRVAGGGSPTEHPNVELARQAYEAMAKGDLAATSEGIADDVTWHGMAAGPLSGTYHGRDEVLAFFGRLARETGGTFRLEVHDVLANDEHTVVLCTMSASRGNKSIEIPVVNVGPRPRWQGHRALGSNDRRTGEHRLLVLSRQRRQGRRRPGRVRPGARNLGESMTKSRFDRGECAWWLI